MQVTVPAPGSPGPKPSPRPPVAPPPAIMDVLPPVIVSSGNLTAIGYMGYVNVSIGGATLSQSADFVNYTLSGTPPVCTPGSVPPPRELVLAANAKVCHILCVCVCV
jgi:hypothetical protein